MLSKQSELIGEHPNTGLFFNWCECEDTTSTSTKKHRKLTDKGIDRNVLIEQLADRIIKHHLSEFKIKIFERKKSILDKHNFNKYVQNRMPFPINEDKTEKGNLGEIILAEYLEASSGLEVLIYKLHHNPNIEQSMKGDDILLFDKNNIESKMIMGEAKYRATPDKAVIMDIIKSLSKDNLPISLSFVWEKLYELGEEDLSEKIDDLITKVHSNNMEIIYVGFLHSNKKVSTRIETHLNSDNENLVIISYGEDNPNNLITESFNRAIERIKS